MSKTTDNIIRLIKAGDNLSIFVKGKSTDSILRIIKAAQSAKKSITLRNLDGLPTDNLLRIIRASYGGVRLEI